MPKSRKDAPERNPDREPTEIPRTDLPPEREPYYEGYFGTEEEGVEREVERGEPEEEPGGTGRSVAEDAAGGDREIW
jgi:hypothetical protein